jgi:hypothetical protein
MALFLSVKTFHCPLDTETPGAQTNLLPSHACRFVSLSKDFFEKKFFGGSQILKKRGNRSFFQGCFS